MKTINVFKSNIVLTFVSVFSTVISFINQTILANYFGTSIERDAYFAAISIPTVLSTIYMGSIGVNFLPKYSDLVENFTKEKAEKFLMSILFWTTVAVALICLGIYLFRTSLLNLFFEEILLKKGNLLLVLLIILLPTFLAQAISLILSYFLNYNGRFLIPGLIKTIPIISSIIFVLALNAKMGIISLAIGFTFGNLVSVLVLFSYIFYYKLSRFFISFKIESYEIIYLAFPLLIAGIFSRSYPLIERIIASSKSDGSISYLGYSNQLAVVLVVLTSSSLGTVLFPVLSKKWFKRDIDGLRKTFEDSVCYILLISIPISIYVVFFGIDWIIMIFQRGEFKYESSYNVWLCLSALMGFFISGSLGEVIGKIFIIVKEPNSLQ
ncbi:MAG: hypothetical protein HC819_18945 [Cyclobacteriaceae bacterium]|nr:hypothetical protein [Cyclobacteriaceae bacterium]